MRRSHVGLLLALTGTLTLMAALSSGCSGTPAEPPPDAGSDGGTETDAAPDAKEDAAPDAKEDAAPDAPPDAEPDAPLDAPDDSPEDAPVDAGPGPFVPPPHPSDIVFDPNKLHQIQITVDPANLAQLEGDLENRVPCSITYDDQVVDNAGIRKNAEDGVVDPLAAKPAFNVKFNEFDKNKDLYTLTRLNLENSVKDPSLLRAHLGYELYRRAAIPAKRTAHAALSLNGSPLGIYVVADAIDKKYTARAFGPENFDGNLYEGVCCGDFADDIPHMDLKDEQSEDRSRVDIIALAKVINTASNDDFAVKVDQRMDLARFIDGYALDALLVHKGGYSYLPIANYFMYDNPADGRFVFLPSGMTDAFGDLNFNPYITPAAKTSKRVRAIAALDTLYRNAILHVLYDLWDTAFLHARIDKVSAAVDSAVSMDPKTLADVAGYKAHVADTHLAVDLRKSKVLGAAAAQCGNGAIEGFEECDDTNTLSDDGCSAVCIKEYCGDDIVQPGLGELCDGLGCTPDCLALAMCGNQIKESGEECDDGNIASGDGCDNGCALENCTLASNQGQNYAFCTDLRTAFASRLICAAAGGELAVPQNAADNTWVTTTAFTLFGQGYWTGLSDEAQDGVWRKPDGSVQAYLPWGPNQPNGGAAQNCLIISFVLSGGWNDKACVDTNGYICALP